MEIDKNLTVIDSIQSKQTSRSTASAGGKKIKSELKLDSGKDTLIQLSDYLHLRTKSQPSNQKDYIPISDPEEAETLLNYTKSQATNEPSERILLAQANSHSSTVFYLLG